AGSRGLADARPPLRASSSRPPSDLLTDGAPMHPRDLTLDCPTLLVRPWADPVIDQVGYDPRSLYVERFWLGILGPSATWLMRYLVDRLEADPDGHELDLQACATSLGLGRRQGPNAAFPRTIVRCCQFGAGRFAGQ